MSKTRVVAVTRLRRHPRYQKYYKVTRRFMAHDEHNAYHTGDTVIIEETRPLSRHKRWVIVNVVTRAEKTISVEKDLEDEKMSPHQSPPSQTSSEDIV
jgi:small subunit ribosomal protein S17